MRSDIIFISNHRAEISSARFKSKAVHSLMKVLDTREFRAVPSCLPCYDKNLFSFTYLIEGLPMTLKFYL